jgi:threonine dehydrogenase-like Zn-dependent dehydrogenase
MGDAIKQQFNLGDGADCVIDATGAESCSLTGLHVCGKGATFVQAGISLNDDLNYRNGKGCVECISHLSRLCS